MDGVLGLGGWQWIFLLEAAPAVLLGLLTSGPTADELAGENEALEMFRASRRPTMMEASVVSGERKNSGSSSFSCPLKRAGHVTAPDQCCKTSESSCQGAVHT